MGFRGNQDTDQNHQQDQHRNAENDSDERNDLTDLCKDAADLCFPGQVLTAYLIPGVYEFLYMPRAIAEKTMPITLV